MRNGIFGLFSDVKNYLSEGINFVTLLLIILIITMLSCFYQMNKRIDDLKQDIITVEKEIKINRDKIHFRYFNLTKSLEKIHNVEIDTHTGEIKSIIK